MDGVYRGCPSEEKVRHLLKDILVIVLFATLANADDWVEMALFAEAYQDYLRTYIELKKWVAIP